MEDFCRTCGKTVNAESCINIFSPIGRRLLHCIRTITNCWVQNVVGYPIYICGECQTLLKKVSSFRKRCTKIEAFLSKRKSKLTSNDVNLAATAQDAKIVDPLRIEEQEPVTYDIKEETTGESFNQIEDELYDPHQDDIEQISECNYDAQPDSDEYAGLSYDVDMQEPPALTAVADIAQKTPEDIPKTQSSTGVKPVSRKYTMRVGKRTMYIKLTDEQQPKRIVDPQRQWSGARPCICEHCGRQFKDASNLNMHLLRHTGTKNYECKQCNEKCYTLHLLRRHQLKHTEGPYECTFCGLQYSTNSSRVRHEREACKKGRAPQSKTELIKRGERTFHCDVCDLWFLRAGNLAQHLSSSNHIANQRRKNKKCQLKQKN
ncbi:zinc finger protein 436 [Drosophila innubila]|uniref:zinc finger protein 436 n=1 Tax=Drosophila innubila TaxID=198719 RepID=UPI00148D02FD|nr:zinc finger protein 436 [Drosophila innubila]